MAGASPVAGIILGNRTDAPGVATYCIGWQLPWLRRGRCLWPAGSGQIKNRAFNRTAEKEIAFLVHAPRPAAFHAGGGGGGGAAKVTLVLFIFYSLFSKSRRGRPLAAIRRLCLNRHKKLYP